MFKLDEFKAYLPQVLKFLLRPDFYSSPVAPLCLLRSYQNHEHTFKAQHHKDR
jgi:hypothetical protein